MCGIAGRLSWHKHPEAETIQGMIQTLVHRGPDAHGVYLDGPVGLGHRRLSIIDTSSKSNQPMVDSSGQFVIVYNGEVYNFLEIRKTLEQSGIQFLTNSDTEVILESYKKWGVDALSKFNGMFAFALWDTIKKRLFLARDRLGKKPLFYHLMAGGGIVFASELKALLADNDVPQHINIAALSHYLSLNYTLSNSAIIGDVHKLEAGHFLLMSQGSKASIHSYWNLADNFHDKQHYSSEDEAVEAFREIFDDAVRLRLISDVPLGAFLSGGVDSSAITASMAGLGESSQIQTFSIGFSEKSYSEVDKARFVADYLNVHHRDQIVAEDFMKNLSKIAYHADEPFADTSILPMLHLADFARKYVKVALSGDGADEIFAGYITYSADQMHHLTRWLPDWSMSLLDKLVSALLPVSVNKVSLDYKLRQFIAFHGSSMRRAHFGWRSIFSESDKQSILLPEFAQIAAENDPFDHFSRHFDAVEQCHYLDQAMYVDIKTWLVDDILVKVDRSTMAYGLEARSPFLDYRLVEFAASLPIKLKMKGFEKKYILKKSLQERLPANILRQRKEGFNAPISSWLANCDSETISQLKKRSLVSGFFREERVAALWDDHLQLRRDNGLRLFGLIMFDEWHRQPFLSNLKLS
ncbi:MAG: asparagine synthase (glutamine-hydrolyzing) [Magnetococcales bacterium]|nr:asparagine synthase (glutamine-hydrolyzing) [Magnetococcales bacterium]